MLDTQTAKLFWNGSAEGVTVPLVATGDGYVVMAHAPGHATSAKLVVPTATAGPPRRSPRGSSLPGNGVPTADDASAKVLAGADVSLDLPARDPEAESLTYEIVAQPAHGTVSLRAPALDPAAPTSPTTPTSTSARTRSPTASRTARVSRGSRR